MATTSGFMRYQWVCSVRDNDEHFQKVGAAATVGESSFKK
jgi:hypothetical protein